MKKTTILAAMLFLSIAFCVLTSQVKAETPTIWTDKADYSPEDTVTISEHIFCLTLP